MISAKANLNLSIDRAEFVYFQIIFEENCTKMPNKNFSD